MNFTKIVLRIISITSVIMWLYSCNSKPINIKLDYPIIKDQISNTNVPVGDTLHLIFLQGFNSDILTIRENGKEIFKKKIEENVPFSGIYSFIKKENSIYQISINNKQTEPFKFDAKYDCVVISWDNQKEELNFEHWIWDKMPGFE